MLTGGWSTAADLAVPMIFNTDILEVSGIWEWGLAYSRDEEGVVPVVTAVEEQDIPLSRDDLLFRTPPGYMPTLPQCSGKCSGSRRG